LGRFSSDRRTARPDARGHLRARVSSATTTHLEVLRANFERTLLLRRRHDDDESRRALSMTGPHEFVIRRRSTTRTLALTPTNATKTAIESVLSDGPRSRATRDESRVERTVRARRRHAL